MYTATIRVFRVQVTGYISNLNRRVGPVSLDFINVSANMADCRVVFGTSHPQDAFKCNCLSKI